MPIAYSTLKVTAPSPPANRPHSGTRRSWLGRRAILSHLWPRTTAAAGHPGSGDAVVAAVEPAAYLLGKSGPSAREQSVLHLLSHC